MNERKGALLFVVVADERHRLRIEEEWLQGRGGQLLDAVVAMNAAYRV